MRATASSSATPGRFRPVRDPIHRCLCPCAIAPAPAPQGRHACIWGARERAQAHVHDRLALAIGELELNPEGMELVDMIEENICRGAGARKLAEEA